MKLNHIPKRNPTKKHRPAVWAGILGTMYAMNDHMEVKYFDYDHQGAIEFAGIFEEGRDPRRAKNTNPLNWTGGRYDNPPANQMMVWVKYELA